MRRSPPFWPGQSRPRARLALLALALAAHLGAEHAQARDLLDRSPRDERRGTADGDGTGSGSRDFELVFALPVLYASSVVREDDGTVVGKKDQGDWHTDPDLALMYSRQFTWVKFSALIGATLERYTTVREANFDTLVSTIEVEFTDGRSDLFVPYVRYDQELGFKPTFSSYDESSYDFAVGFTSGIGFGRDGSVIAYGDADDPGQSSLELEVRAGRRLADPADDRNFFVQAELEYSSVFSKEWTVELEPMIRARWYDDYEGRNRRDVQIGALLRATWEPDWLDRLVPDAELAFEVEVLRNFSTLRDHRYSLWEGGPTLTLAKKF